MWFQPSTDILRIWGLANAPGEGAAWVQLYPAAPTTPGGTPGDTFNATAGEAIAVPASDVKGVRWGTGVAWDISTNANAGGGGVGNLSPIVGETTATARQGFHAEGTNRLVVADSGGLYISTDNGATWSDIQMAATTISNTPGVYRFIAFFRVFGTRVFVGLNSADRTSVGYYLQLYEGTIDWTNRTITSNGLVTGINSQTSSLCGLHYDGANNRLLTLGVRRTNQVNWAWHTLNPDSQVATYILGSTISFTTFSSYSYLYNGMLFENATNYFFRVADVVSVFNKTSLGVSHNLPFTPTGRVHTAIIVNPTNNRQWFLSSLDAQNEVYLETMTYVPPATGDGFGTLSDPTQVLADGPELPHTPLSGNFIQAPSASRGMYIGLGHRYSVTADSRRLWTINTTSPNTQALTNFISHTSQTELPLFTISSVHVENNINNRIILDENWGCFVTNNNGSIWGNAQRPVGALPPPPSNNTLRYRWFRVYGTRIFLVRSNIIPTSSGRVWGSAQIFVGSIDYSARRITGWQQLSGNGGWLNQTRNQLYGFCYNTGTNKLFIASSSSSDYRRLTIDRLSLAHNSHTANHEGVIISNAILDNSMTQNSDVGQFNCIGRLANGYEVFKWGDYLLWKYSDLVNQFSVNVLPGGSVSGTQYLSCMANPDNNSQLILVKYTRDSGQFSVDLADLSRGAGVSATNFRHILDLPTGEVYERPNTLSGNSSAGLFVGPQNNYSVSTSDDPTKIYLKEQTDTGELIGFIKQSVANNSQATVQYRGLLTGLTGLTAGDDYIYEGQDVGTAINPTSVVLRSLPS